MSKPEADSADRYIDLYHTLSDIHDRADRQGVRVAYDVKLPKHNVVTQKHRFEPVYAAGLAKLSLAALMVAEEFDGEQPVSLFSSDMLDGNGYLDTAAMIRRKKTFEGTDGPGLPIYRLFEDMLLRPGNTAFRALARTYADSKGSQAHRADIITAEYRNQGWNDTTVVPQADMVSVGTVSPRDSISQLRSIGDAVEDMNDTTNLATTAWNSMGSEMTSDGLRDFTPPRGVEFVTKSGRYNGDNEHPHVYRHQTGMVFVDGQPQPLGYSYMITAGRGRMGRLRAKITQQHIAGELARYAGWDVPHRRLLGMRALVN